MNHAKKVGIIVAMDEEVEVIRGYFDAFKALSQAPYAVFEAQLGKTKIYISSSGIGKVNAAIATTLLIERYQPEMIINVGIAGSITSELQTGDVLVSDTCVYYDVDATVFGYQHGQVPRMPTHYQSALGEMSQDQEISFNLKKGMLCTGDSFLTSHHRISEVKTLFNNVMAVDMEGAAVSQACYQFKVPFIMVKGISDQVNQASTEDSQKNVQLAMDHAGEILLSILKTFKRHNS